MRKPFNHTETNSCYINYENSILEIKLKEDAVVDIDQVLEQIRLSKEIVRADVYSVLIDANVINETSSQALLFLKNSTFLNIKRVAIVTNNLATRLVANHFRKTSSINPDLQVFKCKNTSEKWLKASLN
ncbi:MAG: hypothetical protein BM555_05065 [Crocinitomix sp. MedPE-SWsnd]|nr:MAG: hypothetical protein BM555_05065 [Crocinitomix sp. MedPE-SWsnd]